MQTPAAPQQEPAQPSSARSKAAAAARQSSARLSAAKLSAARPPTPLGTTFLHLEIVFGVAFILATLFTIWTPGRFTPISNPSVPGEEAAATLLPSTPVAVGDATATPRARPLIGIVAGHWGNDSGAACADGSVTEADINLKIATLVQKYLIEQGFDVDLLKEFDTTLIGYQASALVSIHADSCDYINDEATGFKVAAAMASPHPERAARLTACIRSRYAQATGLPLHSTSVTPDMTSYHAFGEIEENTPAAIIETGFLNLDRQFLTQKPELAAEGITAGILCYMRNESITSPQPTVIPTP